MKEIDKLLENFPEEQKQDVKEEIEQLIAACKNDNMQNFRTRVLNIIKKKRKCLDYYKEEKE